MNVKTIAGQDWFKVAAFSFSVFVVVCGVVGSYAVAQYQIRDLRDDLEAVATQQAGDHDKLTEIYADVRWIRMKLERDQ